MLNNCYFKQAMKLTKTQNDLEDKLALEEYGVKWDELEYDEKEEITFKALEILGGK